MARLSISLLGPVQVLLGGQRTDDFKYHKAQALLAYLAVESDRAHQRNTLVGLLWPNLPNDIARTNLRQVLVELRHVIGDTTASPPFLHITRDTVQFNTDSLYTLDVAVFNELLAACAAHTHRHLDRCRLCAQRLQQAATLYRGDFLAELTLAGGAPFEEWILLQRERLRHAALNAFGHLAAYCERSGALEQARGAVERQLEIDPWREEAHRDLMRLLARSGQRKAALHQYEICRQILAHELDVAPEAETVALYVRIRDGETPLASDTLPRAQQVAALPLPPTPLVGREVELAELGELLANRSCRLITLHGPGGIGKTRLALAAAVHHAEAFEHGVAFVPLETVPAADSLAAVILTALDIPVQGQRSPPARLIAYLREREMLLVLDNFEHLAAGAGLLAELLQRAPRLTLLVTSQTRLALQGEWLFDLQGLRCPPATDSGDVMQFSAARLLVQRMQQTQRDLTLSAADKQAVATICRLVAGIPLAIELAAAAIRERSLHEVVKALEQDLPILETRWQDSPARHTSVRALLEHARQLLSQDERHVFSRLAVFRGGFLAEAAFEVAGATLPVLRALMDKSLLQRETTGRYTMHDLVRPFAAAELRTAGHAEETMRRHLAYFVDLAETAEPFLRTSAQDAWLERLELDLGNLRAALIWALAQDDLLAVARMSSALRRFWHRRGHGTKGRTWLKIARDQRAALPVRLQAKVLYSLGVLDWHQGFLAEAHACLVESVTLWRAVGDVSGLAYVLSVLGRATDERGDHAGARRLLEESQELFRQVEDRWGLALALFRLGFVRTMAGEPDAQAPLAESLRFFQATGDRWGIGLALYGLGVWAYTQEAFALASDRLEQALAAQRETGDRWLAAVTLNVLGDVARCQRAYEQAENAYRESLALFSLLDSQGRAAKTLANLGFVAWARDDAQAAWDLFRQGLERSREVDDRAGRAACLAGMAGVLGAWGQPEPAVRLLSAATAMHEAVGALTMPADRRAHAELRASLAAQLDEPAFARAWAEGQQMAMEAAVTWVMVEIGRGVAASATTYEI